ncbi:MAG: hypothetical protein ACYC7E_21655 [Armatimonadota bacterium]
MTKKKKDTRPSKRANRDLLRSFPDTEVVRVTAEELGYPEKFSDVVKRFAEPLLNAAEDFEQTQMAMVIAVIAWNMALQPPPIRAKMLAELIKTVGPEAGMIMRDELAAYIKRKEELFGEYTWAILDYALEDWGDQYHITVLAGLEPEEVERAKRERGGE